MPQGKPYEILGCQFDHEWGPNNHGKMMHCDKIDVRDTATGEEVRGAQINRQTTTEPLTVGQTVWLSVWQTERGWKARKEQGPRQQSGQAPAASGDDRDRSIVRQHSQHMALLWGKVMADVGAEVTLNQIEAWTDHFDADVQRASGTAQEVGGAIAGETRPASAPAPSRTPQTGQVTESMAGQRGDNPSAPAPSRAPNGGNPDTITPKQITHFILPRQKMNGLSDDDMRLLVKSFGLERLKDLPKSRVDEFVQAMTNPLPTGESDVPAEFESAASEADSEIPF